MESVQEYKYTGCKECLVSCCCSQICEGFIMNMMEVHNIDIAFMKTNLNPTNFSFQIKIEPIKNKIFSPRIRRTLYISSQNPQSKNVYVYLIRDFPRGQVSYISLEDGNII